MPRTKRLHQLKRPNIRQDWSKWNLYNLSRVRAPHADRLTFFQQKWKAKSMLRAYHNPDVREGTWTRMFDRRLPAVVPMDHRYLAKFDGSEMAGGRGMGVEKIPDSSPTRPGRDKVERGPKKTPYMHMTFHPLERRLDTAIFRALFASSTRQARQFVTHGSVKVNGKKILYPSYQLNPGDMFSVDPERVMYATGARKAAQVVPNEELEQATESGDAKVQEAEASTTVEADVEVKAPDASSVAAAPSSIPVEPTENEKNEARKALRDLMSKTRSLLEDSKGELSGKRQRELRALSQAVKKLLSKYRGIDESKLDISIEELQTSLTDILAKVPQDVAPQAVATASAGLPQEEAASTRAESPKSGEYQARRDARLLAEALERIRENPYDPSKPYATPWKPRDYMSAFAFIPRYLEVNQNICSAVYLRHPVARPGLAEVPTPYAEETMALGFNWYLRRR